MAMRAPALEDDRPPPLPKRAARPALAHGALQHTSPACCRHARKPAMPSSPLRLRAGRLGRRDHRAGRRPELGPARARWPLGPGELGSYLGALGTPGWQIRAGDRADLARLSQFGAGAGAALPRRWRRIALGSCKRAWSPTATSSLYRTADRRFDTLQFSELHPAASAAASANGASTSPRCASSISRTRASGIRTRARTAFSCATRTAFEWRLRPAMKSARVRRAAVQAADGAAQWSLDPGEPPATRPRAGAPRRKRP